MRSFCPSLAPPLGGGWLGEAAGAGRGGVGGGRPGRQGLWCELPCPPPSSLLSPSPPFFSSPACNSAEGWLPSPYPAVNSPGRGQPEIWECMCSQLHKMVGALPRPAVFDVTKFEGEPVESEEMQPRWFSPDEIPFDKM